MAGSDVFSALGNPVRRRILEMLRERPCTAGEVAQEFDLGRPAVSEHVQVLKVVGLIRDEPQGRERIYHLQAAPLAEVQQWLHPFETYWRGRMRALNRVLGKEKNE